MSRFYFAGFVPTQDGYHIIIPDIPSCFTCADTLDEGMDMAADVLAMMLRDMTANNQSVPEASPLPRVRELVAEALRELEYAPAGEILYPLIAAPVLDMVPVKLAISLPKAVLTEIDAKAKSLGYTRSGFLAHAAQTYQERC